MLRDSTLFRVIVNPEEGNESRYPVQGMAQRPITAVKNTLKENVTKLLDRDFPPEKFPNGRGQLMALLKARRGLSRANLSKMQRVLKDGSCNLNTVGQIANAFGLDHAYQLFINGLDVKEPQVVITQRQARVLEKLRSDLEGEENK